MTTVELEAERAKQLILDTFKNIDQELNVQTSINFTSYKLGKVLQLSINLTYEDINDPGEPPKPESGD